jgi:uncharacterized 2Fe-2S/4Fe-4S cluster protein (DUF4445 family)
LLQWSRQRTRLCETMAQLTFFTADTSGRVAFTPGSSVREILDAAGVPIRSGCRGNGACGLCLVQAEKGKVNDPTKNELLLLTTHQIEQNTRLACQLMPEDDITIRIVGAASNLGWRVLAPSRFSSAFSSLRPLAAKESTDNHYGLAVDLGTTHISVSLWDLKHANWLSGRAGLNPQYCYGTDVVTRMIAADESPENAHRMALMPLYAISEALQDMCSLESIDPKMVTRATIVGNTAMLALLTETDPGILLQPHSWTRPIDCREYGSHSWVNILGVHPEAGMEVVSPFAGFVGSDLLAGVLATHLTDRPGGLLIDFGTNSEVALWDGNKLWVTSAAGGPAFEGCGMQCGMPAEPGAIYRVGQEPESPDFHLEVIGSGKARGICGSGFVDLIACLRSTGKLTPTGKLTVPHSKDGFVVQREPMIRLTHRDVDMFQRAKAAIGVGIKTLLNMARMSAQELNRVCVCGTFGEHLNICNAQEIGLLPATSPERIELCGNTALAGCERLLLSSAGAADLESLRRRATIINLSQSSDFESLFLESLYLQPLKTD